MKKETGFALNSAPMSAISALILLPLGSVAFGQNGNTTAHPPGIASISVCSPNGVGGKGSCPAGKLDTHQIVVGPDGKSINNFGGVGGISDEHSSVFSPETLQSNSDYLFFVATRS